MRILNLILLGLTVTAAGMFSDIGDAGTANAAESPSGKQGRAIHSSAQVDVDTKPVEPRESGRVEALFVAVGRRVEQGQLIARLRGRTTFEVHAPFAGTVFTRCVLPGGFSGPGRPLVQLAPRNGVVDAAQEAK